jgi:S1-C subfamily serine protease
MLVCLLSMQAANLLPAAAAPESWEKLDKKLKPEVYELNVGIKLRLKNGLWVQLRDLSPKNKYPVFATTIDDRGFRVVAMGTAFPIKTSEHSKTYFLSNRHVVENGEELTKECERFYAGMRLAAERTANGKDVDARFKELLATVNLSLKVMTPPERTLYQSTVDAIWDYYDNFLSLRPDPARILFKKYLESVSVTREVGYFLHKTGPVSQTPLQASVYKVASSENDPDLAILTVPSNTIPTLEFDSSAPTEGQEIQVIGYPQASDQISDKIDLDSANFYAPTFSTGRISRVLPRILQVDAPITNGNSGGPVVSLHGKVLGVIAVRAMSASGRELSNFSGAITISSVQAFAPELFGSGNQR